MKVELGHKKYWVGAVEIDGLDALTFRRDEAIPENVSIGELDPNFTPGEPFVPTPNDIIVTFQNIESARAIQDSIAAIVLRMQGLSVIHKE